MRHGPNTVYEMPTATLEYAMFPELKSIRHSHPLFVYFPLLHGVDVAVFFQHLTFGGEVSQ